MARATDLERTHATASGPCLGDGLIHSQRNSFHAHRPSAAAGHPRASSGFRISGSNARGVGPFGNRAGSFWLDLRCHLFTALLQPNVAA